MTLLEDTLEHFDKFGFTYETDVVDGKIVACYWPTKDTADFIVKDDNGYVFWHMGETAKKVINDAIMQWERKEEI